PSAFPCCPNRNSRFQRNLRELESAEVGVSPSRARGQMIETTIGSAGAHAPLTALPGGPRRSCRAIEFVHGADIMRWRQVARNGGSLRGRVACTHMAYRQTD